MATVSVLPAISHEILNDIRDPVLRREFRDLLDKAERGEQTLLSSRLALALLGSLTMAREAARQSGDDARRWKEQAEEFSKGFTSERSRSEMLEAALEANDLLTPGLRRRSLRLSVGS